MNRAMRTFYTTMGIFLILLFAWASSYLALREWKSGPALTSGAGHHMSILLPERLLPLTAIYRPLTQLDYKMNDYLVTFNSKEESERFNFEIGTKF